jgi:superfamily II DNA/RNA helicase
MPLNTEQIANLIRQATAPGFRGNLVSQGLSRSILWTDGHLPEGAPNYLSSLSSDLLDYGFSLLDLGLQLRAQDKSHPLLSVAFERSAESIEAVVRRGEPELVEKSFLTVAAAAAYHLGHFSARAFSLFAGAEANSNFSPAERTLRNLFVRDLTAMRAEILNWAGTGGFDRTLADTYLGQGETLDSDQAIQLLLNTHFQRALACFDYALETGDRTSHENAVAELDLGIRASNDFKHVTLWWVFSLARHLVDDLWDSSLHVRLPVSPIDPDGSTWAQLRRFFVATLVQRSLAEIDLWPSQLKAVERAYDVNDDLIVSLPTSAGKTRVAEICILRTLSLSQRVVFVTPLRALSAQTERTLRRTFVPLGFSVSSLYGSSGLTGEDMDSLGNRDIVVTTPEKLDFALRNNPALLDAVGLVVLDEGHSIGVEEREVRYEVLVQRLLKRVDAAQRRIVCLSALLPSGDELNDFVAWLRNDQPGEAVTCEWQATRRRFGHIVWQGNRARLTFRVDSERPFVPAFLVAQPGRGQRKKAFPQSAPEFTLATAWRFVEQGQTVLIYCPLRKSVEPLAILALKLRAQGFFTSLLPPVLSADQRQHLDEAINIGTEWLGAYHPAVQCLELGVAIHHGSLPRPFQRAVERLLRDQVLKITIASPTLAQGLNLSATTLLFHSIYRNRETIPAEEFVNVAGRAGRAFVDVEGQAVCVDFESKLGGAWESLLQAAQRRNIKSGLLRLVLHLCKRIMAKTSFNVGQIIEYVAGNSAAWDPPVATEEEPKLPKLWDSEIARLDSAILALLPHELDINDLAISLDEALSGSLWQRTLLRSSETAQAAAKAILNARSKFIWENSTPLQRKGAFFAGVSFNTGLQLGANAATLNALLVGSDREFLQGDIENAVNHTLEFARIVFTIAPFVPDELPAGWEEITKGWILGRSLADIAGGIESEIVEFLENALVYKLVWALEAVRVRAIASGESEEAAFNGYTAMAVETGTHVYAASLLIHCGFASRAAAIKAVVDEAGDFRDARGMRNWILSPRVEGRTLDSNWPTPQTASLWRDFAEGLSRQTLDKWEQRNFENAVNWRAEPLRVGTPVRIKDGKSVFTVKWDPVGTLRQELPTNGGMLVAHVGSNGTTIVGHYIGPRD